MANEAAKVMFEIYREAGYGRKYCAVYFTELDENNKETEISFPVEKYPEKIKSLNLDKTQLYQGVLKGVKGQYLIFEDGTVFNVRNWEGYVVDLEI